MADKRCFVQFSHPGREHGPKSGRTWHKSEYDHRRKFMQLSGKWIEKDGTRRGGNLWAWGEWEPESELIPEFNAKDGGPHHPRHLWKPYWVPRNTYRCLHNTDPFIFGDCFLYSNCGQLPRSKRGLKRLDQGSVIAFGSKVKREQKWALDTVLVVRDSIPYDPRDPRKALESKVPEPFLNVTGGPLAANKNLLDNPDAREFRLYLGATPTNPVCGMYSFFPAVPAGRHSGFPRPPIIGIEHINPRNWRTPKGHGQDRTLNELRSLWNSLVEQVHKAGLILGTHAELPPERRQR